jgi:hypothetical protein
MDMQSLIAFDVLIVTIVQIASTASNVLGAKTHFSYSTATNATPAKIVSHV